MPHMHHMPTCKLASHASHASHVYMHTCLTCITCTTCITFYHVPSSPLLCEMPMLCTQPYHPPFLVTPTPTSH
ncbi:hypothetical protein CLOP_g7947 [Closterium sp. NIES-67]|nr:hypothetical protein CLOP_g7947 [Closterium sp. NIES-67]